MTRKWQIWSSLHFCLLVHVTTACAQQRQQAREWWGKGPSSQLPQPWPGRASQFASCSSNRFIKQPLQQQAREWWGKIPSCKLHHNHDQTGTSQFVSCSCNIIKQPTIAKSSSNQLLLCGWVDHAGFRCQVCSSECHNWWGYVQSTSSQKVSE